MCIRDRCELNQQELQQAKENLHTRIDNIEESQSNKLELIAKKQVDLTQAQTSLGTRCEEITTTVNDVRDQVHSDKEKWQSENMFRCQRNQQNYNQRSNITR